MAGRKISKEELESTYNGKYFDVNGVKVAIEKDTCYFENWYGLFLDSFGNHMGYTNEEVEEINNEGVYIESGREPTVGDIVLDIGAFVGDFSAYASTMGATVYAFEPTHETYLNLLKTAELNNSIYPVNAMVSNVSGNNKIFLHPELPGCNSISIKQVLKEYFGIELIKKRTLTFFNHMFHLSIIKALTNYEKVRMYTVDEFVEERKLERVDLIKADIEGAERYMLEGATKTMATLEPDLAICTYHLPDDPEVLKHLILKANPKYIIIQRKKKLYAYVP